MIERTVRDHETQVISTPLTEKEYNYAANLYENDSVISLGEFTVLELLRLRRITTEDLEMIKAVFDQIDDAKTGNLDKPMLARKKMLRGYGSFDEVDLLREEVEPAPSEPGDELFHYLTENDRANSLPPEITEDMYEAVVDTTLFEGEAEGEVPVDDSMTAGVRQPSVRTSICSSLFPESTRTPDLKTPGEMTQDASSVSSGRVGISRMTFKKYNEVVIPLAVSVVTEGIDTGGDWDLAEYAGDY
ncbi:unnamed protein product [Symbiodinium microadriaticum]|nr:unnamed protein product [Symbiodinium microadriaticum]